MKRKSLGLSLILIAAVCSLAGAASAQQTAAAGASTVTTTPTKTVVPQLVNYTGVLADVNGKPRTSVEGVTFFLYKDSQGGAPLWMETQNVRPDKTGHFSVMLGSTTSQGLPADVFVTGQARWLGVQVNGGEEQPRVLLLSVPYALKAADAETIGGLPPSAFVLATPATGSAAVSSPTPTSAPLPGAPPPAAVTGSGTVNFLPLWTGASTVGNSVAFQLGTGSTAKLGINTTTPATTLDVKGAGTVRGVLSLPAIATATSTAGKNSQPLSLVASTFNSSNSTAVSEYFNWQSEASGNNTANPSATLNLLFGSGTNKPVETGLKIASNGQITFASGQSFPGLGTVTSVASGAGLTGGPITTSGTLSVANAGVTNAMLQHPSLTVTANSPLSGGGSVALGSSISLGLAGCATNQILKWNGSSWACSAESSGGTVTSVASGLGLTGGPITTSGTLGINTSVVPQLAVANAFTNNQSVAANSSGTGLVVINSGSGDAIDATTNGFFNIYASGGSEGVVAIGQSYPVVANTSIGPEAVFATNSGTADGDSGTYSRAHGSSGRVYGVFGNNDGGSFYGAGVYGQISASGQSFTASGWSTGAGVWGDGGSGGYFGVIGTADDTISGLFENNSFINAALYAQNLDDNGVPFAAYSGSGKGCYIDGTGSINCSGSKNAVVPIDGGHRKVALSAIESPKNWFEDFGSEQLSNGSALVNLEPDFGQTVNTDVEYHVFLTPNGDCKGLYVSRKSPTSFEVRELGDGASNVRFDYRIVALRKNYENIRLADHTHDLGLMKMPVRETPFKLDTKRMIPPMRTASIAGPGLQKATVKGK